MAKKMNGAQALMKTLVDAGVEVCFSNPGTSEMHFVAALDNEPKMRAVLALFEGVATGAADGYARMADKPAATLLHLGCGLGNGLANLHNARKGKVPMINIVGDHATYHVKYDAQLQSDIETVARNVSPEFVRTSQSTDALCQDAADAITSARTYPNKISTLILPADVSWGEGAKPATVAAIPEAPVAADEVVGEIAKAIQSGKKTALLLGGRALREPSLMAAAKIAAKHGVKLFAETFPTRIERGEGLPAVERIAYLAEMVGVQLADIKNLITVDAKAPVSFFAYPGKKSYLVPDGCKLFTLASEEQDTTQSLNKLVAALGATDTQPELQPASRPSRPKGKLTAEKVCQAVGHLMPDNSIIVDEAITSGLMLNAMTTGSPRHDMLTLTGGAIGQGLPSAVGAAVAHRGCQWNQSAHAWISRDRCVTHCHTRRNGVGGVATETMAGDRDRLSVDQRANSGRVVRCALHECIDDSDHIERTIHRILISFRTNTQHQFHSRIAGVIGCHHHVAMARQRLGVVGMDVAQTTRTMAVHHQREWP